MTASTGRTATFLLRQPRQVQGFREVLEAGIGLSDGTELDSGARLSESLALTMLWIPPGRFWMGSPDTELERRDTEGPQHLVQLQGFFIGQTPITQAQWRAVAAWKEQPGETWNRDLKTNPAWFDGEKQKMRKASDSDSKESVVLDGTPSTDLHPVEQVSWHDAREFCNRLSQRTGRTYTLPSEAQWEYACRAGTTTPFHVGATITPDLANYNGNTTYAGGPKGAYRQQTTPVGMFLANAWGLHDMHGNVLEWCLDHWHDSYEGAPTDGSAWLNPTKPIKKATTKGGSDISSENAMRLLRGGSWSISPRNCRSAARDRGQPGSAISNVGFRVVCLPQDPSLNP
jgi:formylglycine-generating enzyme required for sulfatase activity